ncbi:conjugal transfer protein TraB [Streptomyces sp. NPDC001118]
MTNLVRAGENDYAGVQRKLRAFAQALDEARETLAGIQRRMKTDAYLAMTTGGELAEADGDPRYVAMTSNVSVQLGGAAVQVRATMNAAESTATRARAAAAVHRAKYGRLDSIRRGRRTKTPKPGFFE